MKISEFENIQKFSEASGSIAVVDDNIEMKLNDLGLYQEYPLNESVTTIKDEALEVSPNFAKNINESILSKDLFSKISNINFDEKIGYYLSTYIGHVLEGDYRKNASSGGMGTWILAELFNKGLIDGVIHVKKSSNKSILFEYGISRNLDQIKEGAKTKYYPVEFSKVIKEVKQKPGRYAFVGIPSFVYALRLLCEKDEILKERIIFFVGLICGHQKSSKFGESLAWQMGIEPGNLLDIDYRYKLENSKANSYGVSVTGNVDGEIKTIIKPTKELFGQNWGHGYFKPLASDFTDDVFNETADIVFGDAWLDEYVDDYLGNNIIIVRNEKLLGLLDNANLDNRIKLDNVDYSLIFKSQSSHYKHTHEELKYRLFQMKEKGEWIPEKRVKPSSSEIDTTRKKIQNLRRDISHKSHYSYQNAVRKKDINIYINELTPYIEKYSKIYKKMKMRNITPERIFNYIKRKLSK